MPKDQKHTMDATNPGTRVRLQLETADEMDLSDADILRLVRRFPERYRDLAAARGVKH